MCHSHSIEASLRLKSKITGMHAYPDVGREVEFKVLKFIRMVIPKEKQAFSNLISRRVGPPAIDTLVVHLFTERQRR